LYWRYFPPILHLPHARSPTPHFFPQPNLSCWGHPHRSFLRCKTGSYPRRASQRML
jgi:hypothetical protein